MPFTEKKFKSIYQFVFDFATKVDESKKGRKDGPSNKQSQISS